MKEDLEKNKYSLVHRTVVNCLEHIPLLNLVVNRSPLRIPQIIDLLNLVRWIVRYLHPNAIHRRPGRLRSWLRLGYWGWRRLRRHYSLGRFCGKRVLANDDPELGVEVLLDAQVHDRCSCRLAQRGSRG